MNFNRNHVHRFLAVLLLACLSNFTGSSFAQTGATDYPAKPIRMVVPQNPGGGTDLYARLISTPLSQRLGRPIVIDNRPGAGSLIGTDYAAKATPDGYTLITVSSAIVIIPSVFKQVPFDPVKDFAPVSLLSFYAQVVVVHPSVPATTIKELIALAKAKPGTLNFATAGNGTPTQLGVELFKSMTGTDMVHVPFNGGGPATAALLGGQVQLNFGPIGTVLQYVKAGRLRALAVTTLKRSPALPEVPTVAESGVPGYEQFIWNGLLAPARTPPAIIMKLHREVSAILATPALHERMAGEGSEPGVMSPNEFGAMIKREVAKWATVIKSAGIQPE